MLSTKTRKASIIFKYKFFYHEGSQGFAGVQPRRSRTDNFGTTDLWASALLEMPSSGFFNFRMEGSGGSDFWIRAQNNGTLDLFSQFGAGEQDFATGFSPGDTVMLTMQLDRANGELNAWANPDLGSATAPTSAAFSSLGNNITNIPDFNNLSVIGLQGNRTDTATPNIYRVDEVRISDDFGDVAPIPEPSAFARLGGLLAFGAILVRRRRG